MLEPTGRRGARPPRTLRASGLIAFCLSLLVSLLAVGACSQPAPAVPTATAEPARPTAPAASPAPTVVPTAGSLRKVDVVRLKKPVAIIVPSAVGTIGDMAARLAAPGLERELGVPVQVTNRPNA